jgi:hypothetical protein
MYPKREQSFVNQRSIFALFKGAGFLKSPPLFSNKTRISLRDNKNILASEKGVCKDTAAL